MAMNPYDLYKMQGNYKKVIVEAPGCAVGTVVDTIANGNMNAVTSNAVYNNIKTTIIKIKNITWTGEGHTLDSVPLNAEIISVIPNINAAVFPYRIEHTWAFYEVKKWDTSTTTYDVTVTYRNTI